MIDYALLRNEVAQHPYSLLFATISGAHLYGFPSPDSDYDLRGVHLLPLNEAVGLLPKRETVETSGVRAGTELDLVTHDALKFFHLMLKRNGYILEQLFSPLVVMARPEHEELKAVGSKCITRHHSHHYRGFAETQWKLFAKEELPRLKPLLYLFRVLLTGIHLMRTGSIEANLTILNREFRLPCIPDLIDLKVSSAENATLDSSQLEFYFSEYRRLLDELAIAAEMSALPEEPTGREDLNNLLSACASGRGLNRHRKARAWRLADHSRGLASERRVQHAVGPEADHSRARGLDRATYRNGVQPCQFQSRKCGPVAGRLAVPTQPGSNLSHGASRGDFFGYRPATH